MLLWLEGFWIHQDVLSLQERGVAIEWPCCIWFLFGWCGGTRFFKVCPLEQWRTGAGLGQTCHKPSHNKQGQEARRKSGRVQHLQSGRPVGRQQVKKVDSCHFRFFWYNAWLLQQWASVVGSGFVHGVPQAPWDYSRSHGPGVLSNRLAKWNHKRK